MYHSDKSFEKEIFSHKDALMARARHLTRNDRDAEDLVQDTLLKACRNADKYEVGTNCRAWLCRIMTNEYISQYRHNQREIESLDRDEELDENSPDMRDAYIDDSEYSESSSDFGDEVMTALSSVPEDFRAIIVMADLQDQSYREISEKLSIPIGTVMSRLFRSRQLLRSKLHDYALSLGIIKA
ncbi:MAG: sigma-70 family RNA polymerase sigma factor [Proteobacteria bacterium]|nr:sigma-70 family RNA polymerase sigma factor [Pseudomonadota bacterium]